jgi:hypothetical protein
MLTTAEVGILAEAIVKAADTFGQKIKEGMIAVQQIKEGNYEQRPTIQEGKQCESCLSVGRVTKVGHRWLCQRCIP